MNHYFLKDNGQERPFKLQTDKLNSFEIKVYSTETDWHSIHIHSLRNFFYLPLHGLTARIDTN